MQLFLIKPNSRKDICILTPKREIIQKKRIKKERNLVKLNQNNPKFVNLIVTVFDKNMVI